MTEMVDAMLITSFRNEMMDKSFWYRCIENLKPGAYGIAFSPYKVYHRVASVIDDTGFEIKDMILWLYSIEDRILCEPATLIRKPIAESSVAENVIKWGVGGLNIKDCRIEYEDTPNPALNPKYRKIAGYKMPEKGKKSNGPVGFTSSKNEIDLSGRYPSNVIYDGSQTIIDIFPYSKGWSSQWHNAFHPYGGKSLNKSATVREGFYKGYDDEGSSARYFKACPFSEDEDRNKKPFSLIEYLLTLLCPKNGRVLTDISVNEVDYVNKKLSLACTVMSKEFLYG